jgi:hypothetical protein
MIREFTLILTNMPNSPSIEKSLAKIREDLYHEVALAERLR